VAVIAVAAGAIWSATRADTDATSAADAATSTDAAGTPTPRPLTADEVPEPTPGQDIATDDPLPTSGGEVTPVITQAGWAPSGTAIEVSGFVQGVIEDGGTCLIELTHDGQTVSAEREGLADATTTTCGSVELGDAEMDSGWWQAVLIYESPTSSGSSAPVDVLVPTR
jgi:hypothetical protein